METEELYKALLSVALFKLGGELAITPEEIDELQKTVLGLRMGITSDGKILLRSVLAPL